MTKFVKSAKTINDLGSRKSMVEYRTIKRNGKNQVIRIEDGTPRPRLAKSGSGHKEKWSAREYLRDKYGEEAFWPNGDIKLSYLDYAIYEAEKDHRITIKKKLERTRRLREAQVRRQVKKLDEEEDRHPTGSEHHGGRKDDHWIQKALRHDRHGRVRENVYKHFGKKGFTENGELKLDALKKGKEIAKEHHDRSLVDAYDFAIEEHEGRF